MVFEHWKFRYIKYHSITVVLSMHVMCRCWKCDEQRGIPPVDLGARKARSSNRKPLWKAGQISGRWTSISETAVVSEELKKTGFFSRGSFHVIVIWWFKARILKLWWSSLAFISCVTLDKSLNLSVPRIPPCNVSHLLWEQILST